MQGVRNDDDLVLGQYATEELPQPIPGIEEGICTTQHVKSVSNKATDSTLVKNVVLVSA